VFSVTARCLSCRHVKRTKKWVKPEEFSSFMTNLRVYVRKTTCPQCGKGKIRLRVDAKSPEAVELIGCKTVCVNPDE